MTIKYLPVLPPNLRPIVKLEDTKLITTDLNFLYSKIINLNNKIKRLKKMDIFENFLNDENTLLQEAVDTLIENEKEDSKNNLWFHYMIKNKVNILKLNENSNLVITRISITWKKKV